MKRTTKSMNVKNEIHTNPKNKFIMETNYLKTKEKQNTYTASSKFGLLAVALFFATSLMAQQIPEMVSQDAKAPKDLTEFDGELFFNAKDADNKAWLWSTDGVTTSVQSGSVQQSHPGSNPRGLTVFNNQLIFNSVLEEGSSWNGELFEFNGTEPSLIKNIQASGSSNPFGFKEYNGSLYFAADNGADGRELWVTDGTENGTELLKNINAPSGNANPNMFFEYNGKLLFRAEDGTHARELWISDGTENGTELVKDINPNTNNSNSNPEHFTAFNNKVYFVADDGTNGEEPWMTDGTPAGTQMLKEVNPDPSGSSDPKDFKVYNGNLYFTANDGTNGGELWVSDGTEGGTELFKDIYQGPNGSYPASLTELDGKLYFGANGDSNSGVGLWVTDGTSANTTMIKETPSKPRDLFIYDDALYFVARDGSNGEQLWVSDGTPSGTEVVAPANVSNYNPIPMYNFEHAVVDGTLYYTADYDGNGVVIWKLNTTLDVENQTKSEFVAYPNPVQDMLHLETAANTIQKIDLFSVTGQRLKSWEGQSEINMAQFAPGSYFVKITTDGDRTMVKQILKN